MKHLKKYNENSDWESRKNNYHASELKNSEEYKTTSHTSLICPHCGFEQNENPENILQEESNFSEIEEGSVEYGNYTCEECNKPFEFCKSITVTYQTNK